MADRTSSIREDTKNVEFKAFGQFCNCSAATVEYLEVVCASEHLPDHFMIGDCHGEYHNADFYCAYICVSVFIAFVGIYILYWEAFCIRGSNTCFMILFEKFTSYLCLIFVKINLSFIYYKKNNKREVGCK